MIHLWPYNDLIFGQGSNACQISCTPIIARTCLATEWVGFFVVVAERVG